jgi:hypothetical protein
MSAKAKRESPTEVSMGVDKEMLIRLGQPLRKQGEQLYEDVYGELPGPGLNKLLGLAMSFGYEEIRRRYARPKAKSPPRKKAAAR